MLLDAGGEHLLFRGEMVVQTPSARRQPGGLLDLRHARPSVSLLAKEAHGLFDDPLLGWG
jgi:hypothetical protein